MAKRNSKKLFERAYGKEPDFSKIDVNSDEYESALSSAYSWYRNNSTPRDEKRWTIEYLKNNKYSEEDISYVKAIPTASFLFKGRLFRMLTMGVTFSTEKKEELKGDISSWSKEGKRKKENAAPRKNVQDYINEQIEEYLGDLEMKYDDVSAKLSNKEKVNFSMLSWLKLNDVKSLQAKKIAEYWKPLANELLMAINKEDDQLSEGYNFMGRVALKKLYKTLNEWIDTCTQYAIEVKPKRKRRKRKCL